MAQALVRLGRIIETVIKPFNNDRYSICLTCYELALSKLTKTTHPLDWANLQRQLGKLHLRHATPPLTSHAYLQANNGKVIEKAIVAYNNTLQVFTREAFPQEWAVLQNDLGGVYLKRIQGDQQENLEKAMQCYKESLEVFDRATYPEDWAGTQNNLGNYYLGRLRGDRATNIETAIGCYTNALEVLTRETHPVGWAWMAMLQNRNKVVGIRCFIGEVFGLTDAAGVVSACSACSRLPQVAKANVHRVLIILSTRCSNAPYQIS